MTVQSIMKAAKGMGYNFVQVRLLSRDNKVIKTQATNEVTSNEKAYAWETIKNLDNEVVLEITLEK